MICFYRCKNPECNRYFSIVVYPSTKFSCPFCETENIFLIRKGGG